MNVEDFYRVILPATGWYCLAHIPPKTAQTAVSWQAAPPPVQHRWFSTQEALVKAMEGAPTREPNWYHATAAFRESGTRHRGRTRQNAQARKCFHMDIDCGAGKPYVDTDAGAHALAAFLAQARAPLPSIKVSSGRGLHIYWCLTEDIAPEDWQRYANALAALAQQHGFAHDAQCAVDMTRLLRPPGALHWSGNRVVARDYGRRYALAQLWDAQAVVAQSPSATPSKRALPVLDVSGDAAGGGPALPDKLPEGGRNNALFSHGRALWGGANPHWHDRAVLQAELLRLNSERGDPPLPAAEVCATAASVTSVPPGLSPAFAASVSAPVVPAALTGNALPEGFPDLSRLRAAGKYSVGAIHGAPVLWVTPRGETGESDGAGEPPSPAPLASGLFYLSAWVSAGEDATVAPHSFALQYCTAGGNWRTATLESTLLADSGALLKYLAGLGLNYLCPRKIALYFMRDYIMALESEIRKRAEPVSARERFGYQYAANGEPVYVHGHVAVDRRGRLRPALLSTYTRSTADDLIIPALAGVKVGADGYYPDSVWKSLAESLLPLPATLAELYPEPWQAPLRFAIAASVASSYLLFAGDTPVAETGRTLPSGGAFVALVSDKSATGKTTAARIGMILGASDALTVAGPLGRPAGPSAVAITARLALHGNLPLLLDEQTGADPAALSALAYVVANGVSKPRATVQGRAVTDMGARWALTLLSTSNTSLRDAISSDNYGRDAEQLRFLEFAVVPSGDGAPFNPALVQRALTQAQAASGAAPLLLARYALTHWGDMSARAVAVRGHVSKTLALRGDERFLGAAMTATLLAALSLSRVIAQETGVQGFTLAPTATLACAFQSMLEDCRAHVRDTRRGSARVLADFIAEMGDRILRTDIWGDSRSGNSVATPALNHVARYPLVGRYVQDAHELAVAARAFADWCAQTGAHRAAVLADLERRRVARRGHVTLEKGIRGASALLSRGIVVDCAALEGALRDEGATGTTALDAVRGLASGNVVPMSARSDRKPKKGGANETARS
jgi:hypothetical protein